MILTSANLVAAFGLGTSFQIPSTAVFDGGTLSLQYLKEGGESQTDADWLQMYDGTAAIQYTAGPAGRTINLNGRLDMRWKVTGSGGSLNIPITHAAAGSL